MNSKPSYKELEDRIELLELQLEKVNKDKVSGDYLGKIINNIGDPVFVKDAKSRMILVNDAFCTIFDLSREEIIGKTLAEDVTPEQREHFLRIDKQVLSDGIENISEEFLKVRDGDLKTIVTKKSCYIDDSGNKLLIGVIHDITSNKQIENELIKAKEKAEESEKLKSAFLANMSHEIRTPLNSILGFSRLLKRDSVSKEKRDNYLSIIESGGQRLLRIINDIVDLSKMDSKQLALKYETCNLNELIDNIQVQFNLNYNGEKAKILTEKGLNDSESRIQIDQVRLAQVLSNLIENSLKYAPESAVTVGYKLQNEMLTFYVKDEGNGIDPKKHDFIFGRFTRVENDHSNSVSGTGLGLSIVKELTKLMKGEVWLESEEGKGATFYFTIPYQIADPENILLDEEKTETESDTEDVILIAEDEKINFLYLQALFEDHPYKLIHAANGEEAIDIVKENNSIGLILMDIKMPKINGLEATREIRKMNKKIPIIALTAYAFEEDKQKVLDAGCTDYLTKPYDEKALIAMVEKYRKSSVRK